MSATILTPDRDLPRWLAFAQPAKDWFQLRRDLATLTAEIEHDLAVADERRPCAA